MQVCSSCHAGCCRKFNVHLTGYDILKLKKNLDIDYICFSQIHPVKKEYVEKYSKQVALFKFTNFSEDEYYTFYLRRIKSNYMTDSYKCMFLQEWDGKDFLLPNFSGITARCGIYDNKPFACAIYPAKLHEDGLTGLAGNPPGANESSNPAYNLCHRPLTDEDLADYSGNTIRNLVIYKYEMDYFRSLAEVWNKSPRDFAQFFAFLEIAYKNRILYNDSEEIKEPV